MYRYIRKSMKPFIAFSFVSMLGAVSVVFMAYIINLLVETITKVNLKILYGLQFILVMY